MTIDALPPAPSHTDSPEDFVTKGDTFVAALPPFSEQVNSALGDLTTGTILVSSNIDDLRDKVGIFEGQLCENSGYYQAGDGGGGPKRIWHEGKSIGFYVDNGGSIIVPTGGDGSSAWLWDYSGPVDAKWYGAYSDNTNYVITTAAIQACFDNEKNTVISEGTYLHDTLYPKTDSEIEFLANVTMNGITAAQGGGTPCLAQFWINAQDNVSMIGNNTLLWMNKSDYEFLPGAGNYSNIRNYNSSNMNVSGFYCTGSGGDGIDIGGGATPIPDNVWIRDCIVDDVYRNGISFTNATNSGALRCILKNAYKQAPGAGVDVEPNAGSTIRNILIKDCTAFGNIGPGYEVIGTAETADQVTFENCVAYSNGESGFLLGGGITTNTTVSNCTAYNNNKVGFELSAIQGAQLINCNSYNNTTHGYSFVFTKDTKLVCCKSKENTLYGFYALGTDNDRLTINDSWSDADETGMFFSDGDNYNIHNNTIINSVNSAMNLVNINNTKVAGNTIENAGSFGIYSSISTELTIAGNFIRDCADAGIHILNTPYRPVIKENVLYNNGNTVGATKPSNIWLDFGEDFVVKDNVSILTETPVITMYGIYIIENTLIGLVQGNDCYKSGSTTGLFLSGAGIVNGGNRNFDGTFSTTAN